MRIAKVRWTLSATVTLSVLGWAQAVTAQQMPAADAATAKTPTGTTSTVQPATVESGPTGVQAEAPSVEQGGDITVTASKRQETLMSVPISVTAVTGDQLVAKGIYDVQDLVKVTAGLSYVESGRSVPVFSLRGVGFFDVSIAAKPTVSVYIDEAPIPFSIEAKGAAFDLERVEVLKGPQGTLFGQNATGGAINYIAAKPTSQFKAGVIASYARFNTVDLQGFVSGPLSSTINARLAVRGVAADEWQVSQSRGDKLGNKRFVQGRFLLDWRPTERLKVSLNANGWHDGSEPQAPQFLAFVPSNPARAPLLQSLATYPTTLERPRDADWDVDRDYYSDNDFYQFNARVDYQALDTLTITSISSYSKLKVDQLAEGDGTPISNFTYRERADITSYSQELRAAGEFGALAYIIGLNYQRDDTSVIQDIFLPYSATAFTFGGPPAPPLDGVTTNINQLFNSKAVFANLDYQVAEKVTVRGGVRYTRADLDFDGCSMAPSANAAAAFTTLVNTVRSRQNPPLPPLPALQVGQCASVNPRTIGTERYFDKLSESNVSWKAGIDFKPTRGTLLYASISKGYKAGSVSTIAATNDLQLTPVRQESVLAYEVGLKSKLLDDRVELTAAAFYYNYRNKQVLNRRTFQPNIFGAINALENIPKSRVQGAEAQLTLFPVRGLTLTATGTYLDTRVTKNFAGEDILGSASNFKGNSFPYTPKWQVVLDGEYRFPLGRDMHGTLGVNANYRSNTTAGFGRNPLLDIDGYWLVDARAGVDFDNGRYGVQVFGRNISNQYYWTNVAKSVDNARRYAGMPATYGIQFQFKY